MITGKSYSNGGIVDLSKTQSTILAYKSRGAQLWRRAAKELEIGHDKLQPTQFLEWFETLLLSLKPASRRQYIASAREYLLSIRSDNDVNKNFNSELLQSIQRMSLMQSNHYSITSKPKTRSKGKTSSQKSKKISAVTIATLFRESKDLRGKWIKPALLWMSANVVVGLRPSEWRYAQLSAQDGKLNLVVINGKNTNNRSHGEKRHLDLTYLRTDEINWVKQQLNTVKQYAKDNLLWNVYYTGVRQAIWHITRKILPKNKKHPTLYTTRHQFSANAKSSGQSKVDIAAMMGHGVDITAGMHYAQKRFGEGGCRVKANPDEALKVRVKSEINKNHKHEIA